MAHQDTQVKADSWNQAGVEDTVEAITGEELSSEQEAALESGELRLDATSRLDTLAGRLDEFADGVAEGSVQVISRTDTELATAQVSSLQAALNELGYKGANGEPLVVDGVYASAPGADSNTRAAVLAFQEAHPDLVADGHAGVATFEAVAEALRAQREELQASGELPDEGSEVLSIEEMDSETEAEPLAPPTAEELETQAETLADVSQSRGEIEALKEAGEIVPDDNAALTRALDLLGVEGESPDARVRNFQIAEGLVNGDGDPDGLAGPITLGALSDALEARFSQGNAELQRMQEAVEAEPVGEPEVAQAAENVVAAAELETSISDIQGLIDRDVPVFPGNGTLHSALDALGVSGSGANQIANFRAGYEISGFGEGGIVTVEQLESLKEVLEGVQDGSLAMAEPAEDLRDEVIIEPEEVLVATEEVEPSPPVTVTRSEMGVVAPSLLQDASNLGVAEREASAVFAQVNEAAATVVYEDLMEVVNNGQTIFRNERDNMWGSGEGHALGFVLQAMDSLYLSNPQQYRVLRSEAETEGQPLSILEPPSEAGAEVTWIDTADSSSIREALGGSRNGEIDSDTLNSLYRILDNNPQVVQSLPPVYQRAFEMWQESMS